MEQPSVQGILPHAGAAEQGPGLQWSPASHTGGWLGRLSERIFSHSGAEAHRMRPLKLRYAPSNALASRGFPAGQGLFKVRVLQFWAFVSLCMPEWMHALVEDAQSSLMCGNVMHHLL